MNAPKEPPAAASSSPQARIRFRFPRTAKLLKHSDFQLGIRYEYVRHKNDPAINFGDNTFVANVPFLMFKYTL